MTTVTLAPHLWEALETMGRDMGLEPGALANQAVFVWLRLNGYMVSGTAGALHTPRVGAPEPMAAAPGAPQPVPAAAPVPQPVVAAAAPGPDWDQPASEPTAASGEGAWAAPAEGNWGAAADPGWQSEGSGVAAQPGAVAPIPMVTDPGATGGEDEAPFEGTFVLRPTAVTLYLEREGAEPVRVDKERFVIGRGPTCDLVLNSPRVSREHVALTRSGSTFLLEDLGSSNGTWLGEERISVRELEDGDVILLGNEPVTFLIRSES